MRILNRPMFRYGGPIKEGVMHGMKNGGRAALVGNPVYPQTGGREHHQIVKHIKDIPKYIKPSYWSSFARPGTLGGRVKNWWLRNKPTSVPKYKNVYQMPGGQLTEAQIAAGMGRAKIPFASRAKSWIKENPYWAYGGAGAGITSGAIPETVGAVGKTLGKVGKTVGLEVADRLIWDKIWDQDKWFKERAEKKALEESALNAEQIEINRLKKLLEGKKIDKVIDPDAAARLAKETQNKRIKSYLDMMGYDQAKKGALSKALIDASAIVQQGTEEAGSLKEADWGKLINQAIQTTSKRLEKPEQIREAVGLMATKAAIEKDLEDPQVKKLRELQIKGAEKTLAGETLEQSINAAYQRTGEFASGSDLAGLARTKGIKITKVIPTKDIPDEMSAIDYLTTVVKKSHDKGTPFPPGNYVIKDRLVEIDVEGNIIDLLGQ